MCKVKLLILLLISSFLFSCSSSPVQSKNNFSLEYVGGSEDGLIFSNLLTSYLNDYSLFNPSSSLMIKASITHEQKLYITNVDNTSDREKIKSTISLSIFDQLNDCNIFHYKSSENQFYVITDTVNFTSNNVAVEQIKFRNNETLIQKLIPHIVDIEVNCLDE